MAVGPSMWLSSTETEGLPCTPAHSSGSLCIDYARRPLSRQASWARAEAYWIIDVLDIGIHRAACRVQRKVLENRHWRQKPTTTLLQLPVGGAERSLRRWRRVMAAKCMCV